MQKYFFQILSQKNAQIVTLKNPDLDLIRRIHSECGFYGFMIRFSISPKSVFGSGNPDWILPKIRIHEKTAFFLNLPRALDLRFLQDQAIQWDP